MFLRNALHTSTFRTAFALRPLRSFSSRPPTSTINKDLLKPRKKVTLKSIAALYDKQTPITVMTAHDYPSAQFCEKANIDIVLVGDSLAMVALGMPSTQSEMLHHCRAVVRGTSTSFVVGDMPFGSYQVSSADAVRNAVRFVQEGQVEAVKLEGGRRMAETVSAIVRAGIPVMGHIGLTPQSLGALGGYRVQGKTAEAALALVEDAKALQEAGCFAIVLEAIPEPVATYISREVLNIPTIGIGAGNACSGQVLVQQDMLGLFDRFVPKFCKQYAQLNVIIVDALKQYVQEVRSRSFPADVHCYPMDKDEQTRFLDMVHSHRKSTKDKDHNDAGKNNT